MTTAGSGVSLKTPPCSTLNTSIRLRLSVKESSFRNVPNLLPNFHVHSLACLCLATEHEKWPHFQFPAIFQLGQFSSPESHLSGLHAVRACSWMMSESSLTISWKFDFNPSWYSTWSSLMRRSLSSRAIPQAWINFLGRKEMNLERYSSPDLYQSM